MVCRGTSWQGQCQRAVVTQGGRLCSVCQDPRREGVRAMPDRPKTGTERRQADEVRRLLSVRQASTLRRRREDVGLSQAEVGQLAGVHRVTVRQAETGHPVARRTVVNVMLTLGCAPVFSQLDEEGQRSPNVVFTASLTRAITRAILELPEEDLAALAATYHELVKVAGGNRYWPSDGLVKPPQGVLRFRARLAPQLTTGELADFDSELAAIFGADYQPPKVIDISPDSARHEVTSTIAQVQEIDQAMPITPTPRSRPTVLLPDAVVGAVVQSGLPDELQQVVLKAMIQRQAKLQGEMARQMDAGVKAMIAGTWRAIEGFRESFDLPDNADSREAVSRALAGTLEKVFEDVGWTEAPQANAT
jgi:DNA-binding XRE family transcriptional regulator